MCDKCYGYIYDILLTPLAINHLLNYYINKKALRECSHKVTGCFMKSLYKYINDASMIKCFKLFRETYEVNRNTSEHEYDTYIWKKFKETLSDEFNELLYAIQLCIDAMVIRKVKYKEQLLEHFFMHKLRHLLLVLPDIHKEHTEKKKYENLKSLGPIPQHRMDLIRMKAGLPMITLVCDTIYGDDLYN